MIPISETPEVLQLRQDMVRRQLQRRGITQSAILAAFQQIPRQLFIPHVSLETAYRDDPIRIAAGQTISQPYVVALMLEYLQLSRVFRVLEIGTGSGYATALLSQLCQQVDSIEVYAELVAAAQTALSKLGIENVKLEHRSGWEQTAVAPVYDRIILWASPPRIPEHLLGQLKSGGLLVAPVGKREQKIWLFTKQGAVIKKEARDTVRFVPLIAGTVNEIDSY